MAARGVNRRVRLLLAALLLVFAATLARAFWVQAVRGQTLSAMAERQHREAVTLPASRGTIFDRSGVPLALGEQATTVYADPQRIRDPRAVAVTAGHDLGIDPDQLYQQLQDRSRGFVYVARKADPDA